MGEAKPKATAAPEPKAAPKQQPPMPPKPTEVPPKPSEASTAPAAAAPAETVGQALGRTHLKDHVEVPYNGGKTEAYTWEQTINDVSINVKVCHAL